eukprot:XP_020398954.1 uncharacterized protein LOC109942005 [Zea mays]
MSLARQFELREQFVAPAARAPGRPLLPAPAARLALPAPPGAKPAAPGTITVEGRTIKRLSQAEQEERRRLGLCYNCDDKFTRGHNRICKRLFLLEGLEEEDEAVEDVGTEETPVFSLQALAGVALTDTMQLQVTLGATSLVAMLDSGSTHNFISEVAAARTGLPLEHRPRLTAMVANGERVACVGVIRNAPLDIGGHCFPADLYVMPLAGYDVVLGTRWLAALGPIMWDFSNHAISFTFQGRAFCWQGLATYRPAAVSTTTATSTLLDELLADFDDVFSEPRGLPPPRSRDHSITLVLDFVEALPRVNGKMVILSVVDRFSKYCHFIPLAHSYTAETVAQAFFTDIVRLHGVPQSIVSDRDPVFTSTFWQELMRLMGTKLHMTSAFHPQSDGQTEAANRVIVMYLRCFTGDRPRQWLRWLPWAEYTYNTVYQTSLRDTPFRVVYGRRATFHPLL